MREHNKSRSPAAPDVPSSDVDEQALRALFQSTGHIRRFAEPHLREFGVTTPQWSVLRALWRIELSGLGPIRLTDLCTHLIVQPPGVSGIVGRLVQMKLVSKDSGGSDQRTRHVTLTHSGRKLLIEAHSEHARWIKGLMCGLTKNEHMQLLQLLVKLNRHLESMDAGEQSELRVSPATTARTPPRPRKRSK